MPAWRVLVIGCGNIAGGFDARRAAALPPLSHAGAFSRHGGFQLLACVEPEADRRAAFMQRWQVQQGHADMAELLAAHPPGSFDMVSVCSPTAMHAEHLQAVLALRPRLVFCEKPVTPSVQQTETLVQRCEAAGIALAVHHNRRWAPDVQQLAGELRAGRWGVLRAAVATYNKGVLNNGSHMLDLLQLLLGPLTVAHAGRPVADFWPDDPSIPGLLHSAEGVPVLLNATHAADAAVFELALHAQHGVVAMEEGGLAWRVRRVVDSAVFGGYRVLDAGERIPGDYLLSTACAVANLADHLQHGTPLASTGRSALAAQRLCEDLRQAAAAQAAAQAATQAAAQATLCPAG
jgi:predicted dehydrogenase